MYFLTPRKCGLFGICCEGIPRQVSKNNIIRNAQVFIRTIFSMIQINYLIDEASTTGKGANTVISRLHHFFSTHTFGESSVHLHADNCSGQNKNRHVIAYLMWRILTGRHKQITLSFLIVGHTKFSPDTCFGLIKRLYRRTFVGCLDDITKVVSKSSVVNEPQLVGTQDGSTIVPMYDWATYFDEGTTKVLGIKKYQHFRFCSEHPGKVYVKTSQAAVEHEHSILKKHHNLLETFPATITPAGLSPERQLYLYEKIREFCPEEVSVLLLLSISFIYQPQ